MNNPAIIEAPKVLDIVFTPVSNPPSLNPVTGFSIITADKDNNPIELCDEGGSVNTD